MILGDHPLHPVVLYFHTQYCYYYYYCDSNITIIDVLLQGEANSRRLGVTYLNICYEKLNMDDFTRVVKACRNVTNLSLDHTKGIHENISYMTRVSWTWAVFRCSLALNP